MARAQNAVGRLRLVCLVTSSQIMLSRALMVSGIDCGFEELIMCLLRKVSGIVWGNGMSSVMGLMHVLFTFSNFQSYLYSRSLPTCVSELFMLEEA